MAEIQLELEDVEFQRIALAAHRQQLSFNEFVVQAAMLRCCKIFQERVEELEEKLAQYEAITNSPPGVAAGSPAAEGLLPPNSNPGGPVKKITGLFGWTTNPFGL